MNMSFQFNFSIHDNNGSETSDVINSRMPDDETDGQQSEEAVKNVAKEVKPVQPFISTSDIVDELELCPGIRMKCIGSRSIEARLKGSDYDSCITQSTEKETDLIPNVYEGGLKVWECTFDLVRYLSESRVPLAGLSVLELGCGAGLPGIYALHQDAAHVCFQDFNEEVITQLTIPNAALNTEADRLLHNCRFVTGDWGHIGNDLIPSQRYDIILTSETIYSTDSIPNLHKLIERTLKPDGTVYVAAKTHYFGVGGGTRLFEDYVHSQGEFNIDTCKQFTEGLQREILVMKRKNPQG